MPATVTPGDYEAAGRSYRAEATAAGIVIRYIRANGQAAHQIAAHVVGARVIPTDNGQPHAARLALIEADPDGTRICHRCAFVGCGRVLTDPESIATHLGPEHRPAAA